MTIQFGKHAFAALFQPGIYPCFISAARFRTSSRGNRMLQVTFTLVEGSREAPVYDFFVLEGGSQLGIATAFRRLVQLYRACGLNPQEGEVIKPQDLLHAQLEVKIEHELWEGEERMRVVSYLPLEQTKLNFTTSSTTGRRKIDSRQGN